MFTFLLKILDYLANAFASGRAVVWVYFLCVAVFSTQANFWVAVIFSFPIAFILSLFMGLSVVLLNELVEWLIFSVRQAKSSTVLLLPPRRLP